MCQTSGDTTCMLPPSLTELRPRSNETRLAKIMPRNQARRINLDSGVISSSPKHALTPCKIYVYDPATVKESLPEKYLRRFPDWQHDPYSTELWLRRTLHSTHPWRAASMEEADLIFIAANFSLECLVGKAFFSRAIWQAARGDPRLWSHHNGTVAPVPKLASLQYATCVPPWVYAPPPPDLMILAENRWRRGNKPRAFAATTITPFVVSRPVWLTSGDVPEVTPWSARRTIFFAGHVPKLYINPLRYLLWSKLRQDPRVTTQSRTLNCTVASMSACRNLKQFATSKNKLGPDSNYHSFCYEACGGGTRTTTFSMSSHAAEAAKTVKRWSCMGNGGWRVSGRSLFTEAQANYRLRTWCKKYKDVDFASELPDMARTASIRFPGETYLRTAAGHKFCLVAQGDPGNTPKAMEAFALAGAGGCLPLFVLRAVHSARELTVEDFDQDYPHVRWLDYCKVAFFVSRYAILNNPSWVIQQLDAVTTAQAMEKHRAARAIRDAFVFRPNSSPEAPAAGEYIFSEACHRAKGLRAKQLRGESLYPPPPVDAADLAGGLHERCTLHLA